MGRQFEYKGHLVLLAALPEQGRWGYRIDQGTARLLEDVRTPMPEQDLLLEAEVKAKAEVDRAEKRRLEQ